MTETRIAATRSELLRIRGRLERVTRGIDLLTRKRRALVADLFRVAHPAIEARARVAERATEAFAALVAARADRGVELEALGWPGRTVEAEVTVAESWGLATGAVRRTGPVLRTLPVRGLAPGFTGPAAAVAATEFERLVELLLDAASTELRLRRLAEALARTTRQVNTLDRRVAPGLRSDAARVAAVLDEREREDHARLKRFARRSRAE